jgi:hypothetical protein
MMFDFIVVLAVFKVTNIVMVIAAVAVIKILPNLARWGFSKVIHWFSFDNLFQSGVVHSLKPEREIKYRGSRSSLVHPAFSTPENLSPESRFNIFGTIFGFFGDFFGGFFTKLFSFFRRKK